MRLMNIVLATLNAKYIHASLAIRYLRAFARDAAPEMQLKEYNINQQVTDITADLYAAKPDVLGMACYIWNITETLQIVRMLKQVHPAVQVVLGGPEVSYDAAQVLSEHPAVDYVVTGEGEQAFHCLLTALQHKSSLYGIPGLAWRDGKRIIINEAAVPMAELDEIPWPYEDLSALADKIIYYECSRGCPFSCQYCLSSTFSGVRFFSLSRVKRDLQKFIDAGVKQVKFVDRTFNCDRGYALEIFKFLAAQGGKTNFHFEIAADLLDEETLDLLAHTAPGRFQFEIGIQSTYKSTLEIIRRRMDWEQAARAVKQLNKTQNIHLHLDLIAGLPAESYAQFRQSFNDVFALSPGRLQLGFLKLLKGSGIRERAGEFSYLYMDQPPYEVLANNCISYGELLRLKNIEDLLEKYYNSGNFAAALRWLLHNAARDAFGFFEEFSVYWQERDYHRIAHKMRELYRILAAYYEERRWPAAGVFRELLKFDYLRTERALQLPDFFIKHELPDYQQRFYRFLGDAGHVDSLLPEYAGLSAREISKRVQIESFKYDVVALWQDPLSKPEECTTTLLFQYERRDAVFHRAAFMKIEI